MLNFLSYTKQYILNPFLGYMYTDVAASKTQKRH